MTWQANRLKFLAAEPIRNGLGEAGAQDDSSWPRYIRTTDIAGPRTLREDVFASLPPEVAQRAMLRRGDIVMTAAGATIGKTLLYDSDKPACYAGYLARFRPRVDVDGRFVAYWMESQDYWDQIAAGKVVSTIENFSASKYQNLRLRVPPLLAQRAIADYLDAETARIDALIEKKRQMVKLTEARFWIAFTDSVLKAEARMTPLRRAISFITDGPFGSAFASADYSDDGAAVVRLGNIGFAEYRPGDQAFIPLDLYQSFLRHQVRAGDLLIAGLGDSVNHAGRACVAPDLGPAMVKGKCFCARMWPGIAVPEYLALLLSSPFGAESIGLSGRGSTRTMINLDVVRSTVVPLPTVERQVEIVLEAQRQRRRTGVLVTALRNQIDLLAERRQALITAAVTGELAIPGVAA